MTGKERLSPEELDVLIGGEGEDGFFNSEAIGGILTASLQTAGDLLGEICGTPIQLAVAAPVEAQASEEGTAGTWEVTFQLKGGVGGRLIILLSEGVAETLLSLLRDGEQSKSDQGVGLLTEAFGLVADPLGRSIGELLRADVSAGLVGVERLDTAYSAATSANDALVYALDVQIDGDLTSDNFLLLTKTAASDTLRLLGAAAGLSSTASSSKSPETPLEPLAADSTEGKRAAEVRPAHFSQLSQEEPASEAGNLDILLDVPLRLTVELGRTSLEVRELLRLKSGQVIELDKLAGEPLDLLVNGRPIAKGEVVVIDDHFGVRITEILSRSERTAHLT